MITKHSENKRKETCPSTDRETDFGTKKSHSFTFCCVGEWGGLGQEIQITLRGFKNKDKSFSYIPVSSNESGEDQ